MKSKPHRHPPQPQRSFISHKAEANKSLVIGIIAILAIIGLGLLLFFSKQFVGKAISYGEPVQGEAGIFVTGDVEVGGQFTVPVKVNLGSAQSVAVQFELAYPAEVLTADCSNLLKVMDEKFKVDSPGDLAVIRDADCGTPGKIKFEYVGLCKEMGTGECSNALTQSATITEITFTATKALANPAPLILSDATFTVIDLETDEDLVVGQVNNGYVMIKEKEEPLENVCGDSLVNGEEQCDNTAFASGYSSDCKLYGFKGGSASCTSNCQIDVNACEKFGEGETCMEIALPSGGVGSACADGLSCKGGVCAKLKCTDSDGGKDYYVKGSISGLPSSMLGAKSMGMDKCITSASGIMGSTGTDVLETYCVDDNQMAEEEFKCPNGCQDGACTKESNIMVPETPLGTPAIELISKDTGESIPTEVSKGKIYTVSVTFRPEQELPENHLLLVTVNYGGEQRAMVIETKKSKLAKDGTEMVVFEHTVEDATTLTVKASAWNTWPSSGETWTNLVPAAEKSYTIK